MPLRGLLDVDAKCAPREPWPGAGFARIGPVGGAVAIRVLGEGSVGTYALPIFMATQNTAARRETGSGVQKEVRASRP